MTNLYQIYRVKYNYYSCYCYLFTTVIDLYLSKIGLTFIYFVHI